MKGEFDADRAFLNLLFTSDENRVRVQRFTASIKLFDELRNAAFVVVFNLMRLFRALIRDDDLEAGVEEGCFLQPVIDLVEIKFYDVGENAQIRLERDGCTGVVTCPDGLKF